MTVSTHVEALSQKASISTHRISSFQVKCGARREELDVHTEDSSLEGGKFEYDEAYTQDDSHDGTDGGGNDGPIGMRQV